MSNKVDELEINNLKICKYKSIDEMIVKRNKPITDYHTNIYMVSLMDVSIYNKVKLVNFNENTKQ
ncbi:hypothetical protein RZE82_00305 [Mollicutes bacterium LVI A0039]|nr:hypothetical protein RZE82_00305 [Mollicutes bacterium LVI A0039]